MVALDTSALIYWTLDPQKLTAAAKKAISESDIVAISSISVWEIGLKVKRGKLEIPLSTGEYARRLGQLEKLRIIPVDVTTWLENLALEWDHRDPADRTIVATARLLGSPLVSSDRKMAAFYPETIW